MPKPAIILLAEDEKTDAYFIEWAFRTAELPHRICHVQDGQEAIDYLSGTEIYGDRGLYPLPDLLLLDLKMPRLDGFAVMTWLRERPEWSALPVVVLSSSQFPADIRRARELGAADYNVKPGNPQKLVEFVRHLDGRWLRNLDKAPSESSAVQRAQARR
jgi:CheY-like chemotaxis protein